MNRSVFHSLGLFALSAFLSVAPLPCANAREPADVTIEPPPQPVPGTVKVQRGTKVDIPLRIYGSSADVLQFFLRTKPEHGTVSEPEARGRDSAVVTYEPPADLSITREKFAYSTRGPHGVSAPVEIQIMIIDKPAQFAAPNTAEFPALIAGTTSSQTVEIANTGGGMIEGEAQTEAPWRIDGSPKYHLGAGARQTFTIIFAPEKPGTFNGAVRFSSQHDRYVMLSGQADPVIAVNPPQLELKSEPGVPVRRASVEIANRGDKDLTVTLTGSDKLQFPKTLPIPAKSHASAVVESSGTDMGLLQEELHLAGAGMEIRLPIQAAATGPFLRCAGESIRLVPAPSTGGLSASLTVENAGGTEGSWKWEIAAPFQASPSEAKLRPGAKQMISLRLESASGGNYRSPLIITGEQQTIKIPVEAAVAGPSAPSMPSGTHYAAAPASSPPSPATPPPLLVAPKLVPNGHPPSVRPDEHVSHVRPTQVVVTWPASLSPAARFKFEERILSLDPQLHQLKYSWVEHPPANLRIKGNQVIADLKGLIPEHPYHFQILPLNASGAAGEPLLVIRFHTPAKAPVLHLTAFGGCFAALLLMLGLMGWQKYRAT